ncbi:MAG: hypothetical protein VKK04_06350 [Synechococcales bacterium]|nr:hypothetical protein [Synechococcales bacterium]
MAQQNFLQQFQLMVEELETHAMIELVKCEFNSPAPKEQLNSFQENFHLTATITDFYGQANGLEICWQKREERELSGGGLAAGYINLLPIEEVFQDWHDIIYFDDDDKYKPLHPIDFFVEEACAALYLNGSSNPQVYYHYLGEEMSSLNVDFEGYLQLLLKSRGFWYWHKAVAQPEYVNPYAPVSLEERNFREIMPQLFPDFKQSDFKRVEQ